MRAIGRLGHKLKSVVTFNFDDLVEKALALEGCTSTSVWKASDLSRIKGVPVYHPHGFLPYARQQDEVYRVVLAEADYHTLYANPHSWSNIAFSTALLESVCLFITTSITDPNVRRVLDTAHREVPDQFHYFIWTPRLRLYCRGLMP
jgi:SIR2-like domain